MNYKITNGAISYGAETILEEIDFEIKDKDKIAIVGRNGCGKTSFLNSIVDNSMLEEGIGENKFNIYKQGNPSIGYLKQINFEDSSKTMLEEILKVYKPIIDLEEKISKITEMLQNNNDGKLIKDYSNALERYEIQGGYTYKKEYETAIKKLDLQMKIRAKKWMNFQEDKGLKLPF